MKFRLQAKYTLTILSLILVIVPILSGALLMEFQRSMQEVTRASADSVATDLLVQLEKRGTSLARFLAEGLINPVYNHDLNAISEFVKIARGRPDVAYIYLYETNGEILHDGTRELRQVGKPLSTVLDDEVSRRALTTTALFMEHSEQMLDVVAPLDLGGKLLGGVRVGMSLANIQHDIAAMRQRTQEIEHAGAQRMLFTVGGITVGFLLGGIILAFIVARRFIQPIQRLTMAATRIGRGDYVSDIDVTRTDELGELARTFQTTSHHLQQTTLSKVYVESIIDSMSDALIVTDLEGTIQMVNRSMTTLTGYGEEEFLGHLITDFLPVGDREYWLDQLDTHGVVNAERPYLGKDGRQVWVSFSSATLHGQNGTPLGMVRVAQDVTERKRIQDELQDAKERAETASLAKSRFLANMSHEIRTPMNGMLGMTELLLNSDLSTRQRHFAETAHTSARSLLHIVNDILDFSKVEAGKLTIEEMDFHLHQTVAETVDLFAERAQQKGLGLRWQLADDTPRVVRGDRHRLRQILANLLSFQ